MSIACITPSIHGYRCDVAATFYRDASNPTPRVYECDSGSIFSTISVGGGCDFEWLGLAFYQKVRSAFRARVPPAFRAFFQLAFRCVPAAFRHVPPRSEVRSTSRVPAFHTPMGVGTGTQRWGPNSSVIFPGEIGEGIS
jgi:hypothetical protein